MRCIRVTEFGGPEVLKYVTDATVPKPGAKQVLVNVKAVGLNPVDTYIRSGSFTKPPLPYTPGSDGAGIVKEVGSDVTKYKEGDRVWFQGTITGACAEYCLCDENNLGVLPETASFEDGAMIGVPYLTAYRSLFQKAHLKSGETVFIHGATGGVGTAAIQVCKSVGVDIIATAGSDDGVQMLKNMGVAKIYNHHSENYIKEIKESGAKIDVILEMLANKNLVKDLDIISSQGRIVVIGSRGNLDFPPGLLLLTEAMVTGVLLYKNTVSELREQIEFFDKGLSAGWVKPMLWKTYDLAQTGDAHKEIIVNKGAKGQIVLKIE